jgi:ClpP class serine protease
MGLEGTSLTDEQRAYLQEGVDKNYAQFVSVVKANRKKVSADALSGKMFDAEDAIKLGLADGIINDLDSLISYLNK